MDGLWTDWSAYHKAGELFLATGRAVYVDPAYSEAGGWLPYLGPPYAVLLWGPLSLLGELGGMVTLFVVGLGLTVWGLRRRPSWMLLIVLLGLIPMSVLKGQIAPLLGGLVSLGPTGALVAVLLKPTWVIPLLAATAARRDWRACALLFAGAAFAALVFVLTPDWGATLSAAREASQATPSAWAWQFGSITRPAWLTAAIALGTAIAAARGHAPLACWLAVFLVPWCFAHDLAALLALSVIFASHRTFQPDLLRAW